MDVRKDVPNDEMSSVHELHCVNCFKINCQEFGCKIMTCRNSYCTHAFHACKAGEHMMLCMEVKVPCLNTAFGCVGVIRRSDMASHLGVCPAGAVICTLDWCRDVIPKGSSLMSPQDVTPLDIGMLIRDVWMYHHNPQKEIDAEFMETFDMPVEENDDDSLDESIGVSDPNRDEEKALEQAVMLDNPPHFSPDLNIVPRHMIKDSPRSMHFHCGQVMRRQEFASHFADLHCRLMAELGFLHRRCPLADAGCKFIERRMFPTKKGYEVIFNQSMRCLAVVPPVEPMHLVNTTSDMVLTDLPVEVLSHLLSFLDSYAIKNLSSVNRFMNNVCKMKLHARGICSPVWRKFERYDGSLVWAVTSVRRMFSNGISEVRAWGFEELGAMAAHLKTCPLNVRTDVPSSSASAPGPRLPADLLEALNTAVVSKGMCVCCSDKYSVTLWQNSPEY